MYKGNNLYIIELFIKWLNKNKRGDSANPEGIFKESFTETEEEMCEHNFMPVDSTGDVLACTKCGFVVKRDKGYK